MAKIMLSLEVCFTLQEFFRKRGFCEGGCAWLGRISYSRAIEIINKHLTAANVPYKAIECERGHNDYGISLSNGQNSVWDFEFDDEGRASFYGIWADGSTDEKMVGIHGQAMLQALTAAYAEFEREEYEISTLEAFNA